MVSPLSGSPSLVSLNQVFLWMVLYPSAPSRSPRTQGPCCSGPGSQPQALSFFPLILGPASPGHLSFGPFDYFLTLTPSVSSFLSLDHVYFSFFPQDNPLIFWRIFAGISESHSGWICCGNVGSPASCLLVLVSNLKALMAFGCICGCQLSQASTLKVPSPLCRRVEVGNTLVSVGFIGCGFLHILPSSPHR